MLNECSTQIIYVTLHPPHYIDAVTVPILQMKKQATELTNLPTVTAGEQGRGFDPRVAFRQLLGSEQVLRGEMERKKMPRST